MELSYDKNKYLKLLSKEYQNVYEVCEEIINL
jgi:fructose-1,6-bisphosphatase